MKKLMFATALVASAAAFADPLNAISFEGYQAGFQFTNGQAEKEESPAGNGGDKSVGPYFLYFGDQDGSLVKAFGVDDNATAPNIGRPTYFASADPNAKYLDLSTEGGILWRSINPTIEDGGTNILGTAQSIPATGIYLDTLVQFTPTEDSSNPPDVDPLTDKLSIWLNVDSSGASPVTNLMVYAAVVDDSGNPTPTMFTITNKTVNAGEWHRLTIKAIADICEGSGIPAFQIRVDGDVLMSNTRTLTAEFIEYTDGFTYETDIKNGALFASLLGGGVGVTPTVQAVGFKGSGALDDIVWTEEEPSYPAAAIDFTLTWASGVTPVSYTIDGGTPVSLSGETSPFSVPGLAGGEAIVFTFTNADGVTKTMSATAADDGDINAADAVYTWADYLGDAVNGAYEIDNLAELKLFQKGCATNATSANLPVLATAGETFKLTADIALDVAWPGIGLQNGKDVYNKPVYTNCAFRGTFDGQNHTISGFQMVGGGLDYCGFFNSTLGATISNFKIQYAAALFATDTTSSSAESGATFVGVANASTLQNLTTVAGTVSCSKGFGGIAGYTTRGTVIDSCTNNVNMTSLKPNKCGGIAMITQNGSGNVPIISNCQNNGTIAGSGETGSFVGYIGNSSAVISNCESTVDYKLFHAQDATPTVAGIIKGSAAVASYTYASSHTVSGLDFATVEGNVATFVTDGALETGNTYKAMSAVAAYAFASAGSITFDESLVSPTVTADAAYVLSQSGSGTVTYTAALAVAEITGGAKYATLQAAVDAATAGDTVTVLADCTISGTPLSIAKNLTIHNDHTITGAVNYAICIGAAVAFEGSGKIERASGITGSAFCVGANEATRGAITVGTAGALTFDGLTVCGGSGGNLIKLENGTVTMNGGVLRDGKRGIKADADVGTYTSAIVINGGTITNNTDCAVMASAESADGTATVTINGGVIAGALVIDKKVGTYSITIPGTSTAKFNADQSAFCESGYETTDGDNDGWFTVSAVQSAYPTYLTDADADVKAAYDTWKVANGADTNSEYENQFLVNAAPATVVPATALAITAIEQNETAGWDITVECTAQGVDLGGTVGTARVGNGYLAVSYAETLTGTWITENIAITASANGKVTVNVNKSGAKFMKVKLSPKQEIQN